jgi:SP family general alpha glucoside:H+ symporter-like MFS transporter
MAVMMDNEEDVINIHHRKHKPRTCPTSTGKTSTSNAVLVSVQTTSTANTTTPLVANSTCSSKPASAAIDKKNLTLLQGVRQYPKAITWSVLLSLTLIIEGYSTILIPNLFALGPFKQQFGDRQPSGAYEISAPWQSALVNGGLAGQILGLFAAGTLAEKIGYRHTLMVGLWLMTAFISVPFFATNKIVLLIGQCLMGAPWGLFQCISTVYAADVCPVGLRAYLTTYVSFLLASLQALGGFSNRRERS